MYASLSAAAVAVLLCGDADAKAELAQKVASAWRQNEIAAIGFMQPPERPARPERPELKRPGDMPRRRLGNLEGRIALLHALAHIELNAIDLAFDLIARFATEDWGLPIEFFDDWVSVGADEARHFQMLQNRLQDFERRYGDLPAHDGLWQAAFDTKEDFAARLAVIPMILEARGLDVTPATVKKLRDAGDVESAEILQTIYGEEIPHVAIGTRWFEWVAAKQNQEPIALWRQLVKSHFKGTMRPPFNHEARQQAGMAQAYYYDGQDS